jgi:phosphoglucosamine mutase
MSTKLFGTDGIRACAGEFPLNAAAIIAIGRAVGEKLGGKVLVGQDTRISSPWIFELLQKGFALTPSIIQNAGVIPTPAIALLTKWLGYSGGLMISASHNAYADNGIKVFGQDGTKLKDTEEAQIEQRIYQLLGAEHVRKQVDKVPACAISASNSTGWNERYQEILLSHFPNSN